MLQKLPLGSGRATCRLLVCPWGPTTESLGPTLLPGPRRAGPGIHPDSRLRRAIAQEFSGRAQSVCTLTRLALLPAYPPKCSNLGSIAERHALSATESVRLGKHSKPPVGPPHSGSEDFPLARDRASSRPSVFCCSVGLDCVTGILLVELIALIALIEFAALAREPGRSGRWNPSIPPGALR